MDAQQEFRAPWCMLLKGISGGVVVLLIAIAFSAKGDGVTLLLLPLILILALPFMIRGYAIDEGKLVIKRLGWQMEFPLADLESVKAVPNAINGSIRLCGNGGLFSFTGLFRSKKLGNFRCFVNDIRSTVVLRFPKRTIVISPEDPAAFVAAVKMVCQ